MKIKETVLRDDAFAKALQFDCLNDDGLSMSHAYTTVRDSRYDGQFIKALLIGGIGTPPQYRRHGCVRTLMDAIFFPRGGMADSRQPAASVFFFLLPPVRLRTHQQYHDRFFPDHRAGFSAALCRFDPLYACR